MNNDRAEVRLRFFFRKNSYMLHNRNKLFVIFSEYACRYLTFVVICVILFNKVVNKNNANSQLNKKC